MTAPSNVLRLFDLHPERDTGKTISLVDGKLVFSDPGFELLIRRWREDDVPDPTIFEQLNGYGNGYYVFKR